MAGGEADLAVSAVQAAEAYEHHLVPPIFGPWAALAVDLAAPKPGEAVLDAACGTGIGVRLAAPCVLAAGRLAGVDNDPGMVSVARQIAGRDGITADWRCESVLQLPFADATFDLCLCLQGPQFISDPAGGLVELRRVLKSSGRLIATMWCAIEHNKGHYALAQALERQGLAPATRPFSLGDSEEVRTLMQQAGFGKVELQAQERQATFPSVEAFVAGVAAGAPATRHALAQLTEDSKQQFVMDVEAILQPYVNKNGVTLPTRAHLIFATP
ncbi:MAG: methyltransferase domain-containing protein [Alphaproteobacteria bacterium]|nr:MAG: methyltransferase domain-containing protein [Alphaproteobacteria bacterium]